MRYKIILLFLIASNCFSIVKAQSIQLFQVDTADQWVGNIHYFNAITLSSNKIIHCFNRNQSYNPGGDTYGDVKINIYDTQGRLQEQEKSYGDSLFITKTLLKSNGEKIILGDGYRHLDLYGMDTSLAAINGKPSSYILHLDASNQTLNYAELAQVRDITLDETTNTLYFVEQYAYDSANVYAYNLSNGQKSVIATIDEARLNARILKTKHFIYIAGATINFAVTVNGQQQSTPFAYGTFILQLNNNGGLKWIKIVEDITTPDIGLATAPDQGVYMSADLNIPLVIGMDSLNGPGWGGDFILTRIDSNGNFLWARDIPNISVCGFTLGSGFHIDNDDNFDVYLAGASRGIIRWPDSSFIGRNGNIMVPTLLIYDKDGIIKNHLIAEAGEAGSFFSVDVSGNGDFVITGKMTTSQTFSSVTKTITDGGYHPYFLYYKNSTTSVQPSEIRNYKYRIYPNPLSGTSLLTIEKKGFGTVIVEITNSTGQKVFTEIINTPISTLLLKKLQPGLYYITINGDPIQKILIES